MKINVTVIYYNTFMLGTRQISKYYYLILLITNKTTGKFNNRYINVGLQKKMLRNISLNQYKYN